MTAALSQQTKFAGDSGMQQEDYCVMPRFSAYFADVCWQVFSTCSVILI
jgi:hypothetical protein